MNLVKSFRSVVGIGIVTYNNLPLLETCFSSWRKAATNYPLVVFDNGSSSEVVAFLKRQVSSHLVLMPQNMGLCFARNRIIEFFRDEIPVEFLLFSDSDVRFHDGMVEAMLDVIRSDARIGCVGFSQANKGFPVSRDGFVEEIANECQLTLTFR